MESLQNVHKIFTPSSYTDFFLLNDQDQETQLIKMYEQYVQMYSGIEDNPNSELKNNFKYDTVILFKICRTLMIDDDDDDEDNQTLKYHLDMIINNVDLLIIDTELADQVVDSGKITRHDVKASVDYMMDVIDRINEDQKYINKSLSSMTETLDKAIVNLSINSKINDLYKTIPLKITEFRKLYNNFDSTNLSMPYISDLVSKLDSLQEWFMNERDSLTSLTTQLDIDIPECINELPQTINRDDINLDELDSVEKTNLNKTLMTNNVCHIIYYIDLGSSNIKLFTKILNKIISSDS